jgi:hypothetical protein
MTLWQPVKHHFLVQLLPAQTGLGSCYPNMNEAVLRYKAAICILYYLIGFHSVLGIYTTEPSIALS